MCIPLLVPESLGSGQLKLRSVVNKEPKQSGFLKLSEVFYAFGGVDWNSWKQEKKAELLTNTPGFTPGGVQFPR
jgi:hypothetical protein